MGSIPASRTNDIASENASFQGLFHLYSLSSMGDFWVTQQAILRFHPDVVTVPIQWAGICGEQLYGFTSSAVVAHA